MLALCLCLGACAAASIFAGALLFISVCLSGETYSAPLFAGLCVSASLLFFLPRILLLGAEKLASQHVYAQAVRLRPMLVWSLVIAAIFCVMGCGILHESEVSERMLAAGWAVAAFSLFAACCAFAGTLRPFLFTPVIYVALLLVWLMVPVAGMEAYMQGEGILAENPYGTVNWKWTYFFCVLGTVAAIRLLALRQSLLRAPSASSLPDSGEM